MRKFTAGPRADLLSRPLFKISTSFDRSVPPERTLAIARALCEPYGITRIAETTYLDRIGIPCVNVYAPATRDAIGVYNGKGLTREQAIVSGLTEALERQICARCDLPRYECAASDIVRYLDLRALGWIGLNDGQIECVTGTDLLSGESIAVPVGVVECPRAGPRQFAITSTNGLASGNEPVEAAYHALFELCERHVWSQVHVLAHVWPRLLRARMGDGSEQPDDPVATEVVVTSQTWVAGELVERIRGAGLEFRLLCYAPPGWPIAMQACIVDRSGDGMFYHLGMGCSWSPLHAATRAITEAAQVRLGDISGAREDLWVGQESARGLAHGRRPAAHPVGRWYFDGPVRGRVSIDELPDRSRPDLTEELQALLDVMRANGERCVAYVDLSPEGVGIHVARVIAPSLERTLVDGSVSERMRAFMLAPLPTIR